MVKHTKDRGYYRSLSTPTLLDETKWGINPDWKGLSLVLAERLDDKHRALEARHYDALAEQNNH